MANDPGMSLVDVQWVLGHAHLSTTEIYLTRTLMSWPARAGPGYRPEVLQELFGPGMDNRRTSSDRRTAA
jgi:hypothetical protein